MAINWDLYSKKLNMSGNNIRERQINLMKDAYANDFSHSPSYRDAYINNSEDSTGIQVLDTKFGNVKTIYMLPDHNLAVGDVVEFDNNKWLCVNAVDSGVNISGTVNRCTHTLTINKNSILYEVPCCVESGIRLYQMGELKNQYVQEPSTIILVRVPANDITLAIDRGQIYSLGINNYRIQDINDVIEPNILILKMEWVAKTSGEKADPEWEW